MPSQQAAAQEEVRAKVEQAPAAGASHAGGHAGAWTRVMLTGLNGGRATRG